MIKKLQIFAIAAHALLTKHGGIQSSQSDSSIFRQFLDKCSSWCSIIKENISLSFLQGKVGEILRRSERGSNLFIVIFSKRRSKVSMKFLSFHFCLLKTFFIYDVKLGMITRLTVCI